MIREEHHDGAAENVFRLELIQDVTDALIQMKFCDAACRVAAKKTNSSNREA